MFDNSVFWPKFKDAGFLDVATVTSGGITKDVDVGYSEPDRPRFNGAAISRDYEIEYQAADLPALAEGDLVTVKGIAFKVREAPYVPEPGRGSDGYFLRVLLTKL